MTMSILPYSVFVQVAQGLLLLASVSIVAFTLNLWRKRTSTWPLPPGPKPHWLFGNVIPTSYAHRTFARWTQEFGPIFTLRKGRSTFIIIGGQQAAIDIMEKENASLADRPHNISAGEIMSGNKRTLLMGQGDGFKKFRKALQSQLNIKVVQQYEPIQSRASKDLLLDIMEHPELHQIHTKRYAASVVLSATYGKTTPTLYSDPVVQEINKCLGRLGLALRPGAYLVDSYPILRYVPGYLKTLKRFHKEELALFRGQLETVRTKMETDDSPPCFAKYLLERQADFELTDDELSYLAGSMFGAGADTTAAAISVVIMAAANFPQARQKVQEQLDAIVGRDRLPTFGDMEELTEVQAFIQESYRWRPVSVGGFPHRASQDILYGKYLIPAGATVIANHWALARDTNVFHDPENFLPSRWLTEGGQPNENLKFYNFGFGRRVCPGQHLANRSLFINTARLLWAFNILQDPAYPIDVTAFSDLANTHPLPFRVTFEPRINNLKELILSD